MRQMSMEVIVSLKIKWEILSGSLWQKNIFSICIIEVETLEAE